MKAWIVSKGPLQHWSDNVKIPAGVVVTWIFQGRTHTSYRVLVLGIAGTVVLEGPENKVRSFLDRYPHELLGEEP